jgi:hypothetical protein
MTSKLITFRRIPTFEEAKDIETLLNAAGINTELIDDIPAVDVTFTSRTDQNPVILKIKAEDFDKAQKFIETYDQEIIEGLADDYYLFQFNDEELFDIIHDPEDWGNLDYQLAQSLLRKKGHTIDNEALIKIKEEKLAQSARPESVSKTLINLGYFFALLGGFIGIVIGYSICYSKKTLPNGEQIFVYNQENRRHAKNIFHLGIIFFLVGLVLKLVNITFS